MTDDWVYVGPNGVMPKADIIGWIASGHLAGAEAARAAGRGRRVTAQQTTSACAAFRGTHRFRLLW